MTSSKSEGTLMSDAIASLKELRGEEGKQARIDKATREEYLRQLLKRHRNAFLERENEAAMLRNPDQRGMGARKASVAKVFDAQEVHTMLFSDTSVKRIEDLVDTTEHVHF